VASYFRWVLFFLVVLLSVMGGALFVGNQLLTSPGPNEVAKNVVIPRGAGPSAMSRMLHEQGVIRYAQLFRIALMIDPTPRTIKAGEYEVPAHTSMVALLELLQSGKQVQRRFTVPEGMTTWEIVELLKKTEMLTGDVTVDVKEGDLLPETYFYSRDDTRDSLVMRMKEAMEKALDEAWRKRAAGLPLANRLQALTLASIVEKETSVAAERPRVAAVYINRLRHRMKLESDPTTVYAVTGGKGPLGRELTRADLQSNSPYNTYFVAGLPPGPIANPGRAAIQAALNPTPRERAFFFVADGQGGHVFAQTLVEHQRNVARWREIQRQKQEAQGGTSPPGPALAPGAAPPPAPQPAPAPRR
jgi:UPF0755 protein